MEICIISELSEEHTATMGTGLCWTDSKLVAGTVLEEATSLNLENMLMLTVKPDALRGGDKGVSKE